MNRIPQRGEAPNYEQLPMQLHVKIYPARKENGPLAYAAVDLNGCFAVQGIRILDSKNGPFVAMPSRKVGREFKDYCFPCTPEFKRTFDETVLEAYRLEMNRTQKQKNGPTMGGMNMKG